MVLVSLIGVGLGLLAEFFGSFGNIQIKYSHVLERGKNAIDQKVLYKRQRFWIGIVLYMCNILLNLGSFMFASLNILSTTSAITIVINAILARIYFNEHLTFVGVIGSLLIMAGCTVAIIYGTHDQLNMSVFEITNVFKNDSFVILCVVYWGAIILCGLIARMLPNYHVTDIILPMSKNNNNNIIDVNQFQTGLSPSNENDLNETISDTSTHTGTGTCTDNSTSTVATSMKSHYQNTNESCLNHSSSPDCCTTDFEDIENLMLIGHLHKNNKHILIDKGILSGTSEDTQDGTPMTRKSLTNARHNGIFISNQESDNETVVSRDGAAADDIDALIDDSNVTSLSDKSCLLNKRQFDRKMNEIGKRENGNDNNCNCFGSMRYSIHRCCCLTNEFKHGFRAVLYAFCVGGIAAWIQFAGKIVGILIWHSIISGQNQFNYFSSWIVLLVAIVLIFIELFLIAEMLKIFDAVLIVPLYDTLLILGIICVDIGSFGVSSMLDTKLFSLAVGLCCLGMFILTLGQRHASYFHESGFSLDTYTLAEINKIVTQARDGKETMNMNMNDDCDLYDTPDNFDSPSHKVSFTTFKEHIKSNSHSNGSKSNYGTMDFSSVNGMANMINSNMIHQEYSASPEYWNDSNQVHGTNRTIAETRTYTQPLVAIDNRDIVV